MTAHTSHPRVLLVEDDPDSRLRLQSELRRAGYEVDVATDGGEVMSSIERSRPDAVIMDLVLPGVNGFEAARSLRRDPETQRIPLVAITSSWLGSKPDWLQEFGFDAALRKPIDAGILAGELARVIGLPTEPSAYLEDYGFAIAADA